MGHSEQSFYYRTDGQFYRLYFTHDRQCVIIEIFFVTEKAKSFLDIKFVHSKLSDLKSSFPVYVGVDCRPVVEDLC